MSLSFSSITSAVAKTNNVRRINNVNKTQILPRRQAEGGSVFLPTVRTLSSTFPPTMFASAQKVSSVIPKIDLIENLLLKVTQSITSGSLTFTPCNYWFDQQDLRNTSSGRIVQTQYNDTAHVNMLNRITVGKEKAIFETANICHDANGKYGVTRPLSPGTYTYYIPLMASVFENFRGLYLDEMIGDLTLDLTTPSTIIASGAGTFTTTIEFVVEGVQLSDNDRKDHVFRHKMHASECQYLQPIRTEFRQKTLTAGSNNNFLPISNVDGLCAYQAIFVRPTGTAGNNVGFNSWKLLDLGDSNGAGLDLVTSSGASILGGGSYVPCLHIRQHQSVDQFDNAWIAEKPVYFLNYSSSMNAALAGIVNGGYMFDSSKMDQIRISLPSAPVNEVQTLTQSVAIAAAGWYRFSYKGELSAQLLGNATVAQMKAAIEAMRCFACKYVTVTCSAVASAGTSFTITFVDPEAMLNGELLEIQPGDAAACSSVTTRTVSGIAGIATGAYDIFVYSYVYNIAGYNNGKLSSQLLMA